MKTCSFVSLSLSLALAYASPSFATLATLSNVTSDDNCGNYSTELTEAKVYDNAEQGYIGESLRVFFESFTLSAEKPGVVSRNCKLTADVTVPAGYRFRPTLATAEGFYSIQNQSRGGIKVGYVVQPGGQSAWRENPNPFTGNADINCRAELKDPRFSTCYNKPNKVTLETKLGMWIDQSTLGYSVMQLDATRAKTSLKWNWQLQSCKNFFDQKWFTVRFWDWNNDSHSARLFFDLTNGRFDTNQGTGWLYDVKYSEDGLAVEANWYLEKEKKSGWLKLEMTDVNEGKISGHWGDSSGFKDMWTGSYEKMNDQDGQLVSVEAPTSLQNFGSFSITVYSKLSTPIDAEFYIKEEGGNYAAFAEKRFVLYPGINYQVVTFQGNPVPYRSYRAELRFLQNNYTKEIWSSPVNITW